MLGLELRARNNVAWLLAPDDPRRTLDAAREGFEVAARRTCSDWATQLASVAVVAAIDTGDWDWALATIKELEDQPRCLTRTGSTSPPRTRSCAACAACQVLVGR